MDDGIIFFTEVFLWATGTLIMSIIIVSLVKAVLRSARSAVRRSSGEDGS